mmetsp:Transcript_116161/g.290081  ORF Transcript_116161/g.290081 Transcript_116161/m.290081 type:complete len:1093 (-) Transcript_116161:45-3323(-)
MVSLIGDAIKEALPELFVETNVVAAEQTFERRLKEYEMNIEQQKLLREDLRDLVELTVGRMDVYHLVGAMLLEFCISFYCENKMAEASESDVPPWVLTFFLINNLSAAGFLILAVWLSMHASVASHSIGVRLLTRFARLSIPSRDELEDVAKAPLVPLMERFKALGQRFKRYQRAADEEEGVGGAGGAGGAARGSGPGQDSGSSSDPPAGTAVSALAAAGRRVPVVTVQEPPTSVGEGTRGQGPSGGIQRAIDEGARVQGDKSMHFRRFLREQRRWLCYDAFARVCMSLGMNQMLMSLSYYSIGIYVQSAPAAALIMICGIQWLSLLVLRLDVVPGSHPIKEVFAVISFVPTPPIYVGVLIAAANYRGISELSLAWAATPAFLLHACWLFMVAFFLIPPGRADISALPKQLRTVLYLDVLHVEQDEAAHAALTDQAQGCIQVLRSLCEDLRTRMQVVMDEERASGFVSGRVRKSEDLQDVERELRSRLQEAREVAVSQADAEVRAEVHRGQRTLDHFAVWQQAPEIHASLEAFRHQDVKSWLSENQRLSLECNYQAFLRQCHSLGLGIVASNAEAAGEEGHASLVALAVAPGEELTVRVEAPPEMADGLLPHMPVSVWITPNNQRLQYEPPREASTTSFHRAFEAAVPHWTQRAMDLRRNPTSSMDTRSQASSSVADAPAGLPPRMTFTRCTTFGGAYHMPERSELPLMPSSATPPQELPGVIVRRFTCGVALMWLVAAAVNFTECFMAGGKDIIPPTHSGKALNVTWPEPAGLFEVAWMHCNSSHMLVNNRFSVFAAQRFSNDKVGPFMNVADGGSGTVICDFSGCDLLSLNEDTSVWRLAPLPAALGSSRTPSDLPLPLAWHLTAATWVPCGAAAPSPCDIAVAVAGWDGQDIILAHAVAVNTLGGNLTWTVRSRFAVHPGRNAGGGRSSHAGGHGHSDEGHRGSGSRRAGGNKAKTATGVSAEVLAMGFGAEGRTLSVLESGGVLEAWDLVSGKWLGQWYLPWEQGRIDAPHAMCHDGRGNLILAHAPVAAGDPPHLARFELPQEVRHAEQDAGCVQGNQSSATGTQAAVPSQAAIGRTSPMAAMLVVV